MADSQQFALIMASVFLALLGVSLLTPWGRQGFGNLLASIHSLFTHPLSKKQKRS